MVKVQKGFIVRSSKIRVYELAKELQIASSQVLKYCQQLVFSVRTASSSVTREQAVLIRELEHREEQLSSPATAGLDFSGRVEAETPNNVGVLGFDIQSRLLESDLYFNREVSWLWFNERVLSEAFDSRTPLLEKVKFLAIFSSNLDEYFMVRVAGLRQQVDANVTKRSRDGLSP